MASKAFGKILLNICFYTVFLSASEMQICHLPPSSPLFLSQAERGTGFGFCWFLGFAGGLMALVTTG